MTCFTPRRGLCVCVCTWLRELWVMTQPPSQPPPPSPPSPPRKAITLVLRPALALSISPTLCIHKQLQQPTPASHHLHPLPSPLFSALALRAVNAPTSPRRHHRPSTYRNPRHLSCEASSSSLRPTGGSPAWPLPNNSRASCMSCCSMATDMPRTPSCNRCSERPLPASSTLAF